MTAIAMSSVAPVIEGSVSGEVTKVVVALDDFEVSYETNLMGTAIETDGIDELLAAVGVAHKAVNSDRMSTFLKIDGKRTKERTVADKVDAVEAHLGWETRNDRE